MKLQKTSLFIKSLIKSNFLLLPKKNGNNINVLDIKITFRGLKQLIRLLQYSSKVVVDPADKYFDSCLQFLPDKYSLKVSSIKNYLPNNKFNDRNLCILLNGKNFEYLKKKNIYLSCFVTTSLPSEKKFTYSLFNEIQNIEKFFFLLCLIKKVSDLKKKHNYETNQ